MPANAGIHDLAAAKEVVDTRIRGHDGGGGRDGGGSSQFARDRANAAQRLGSDPAVSAFVGASAGSGKTKLLTDRLLRLMLGGAAPERIQCLTFTKAAAAEMAVRLHRTLGEWVTLDDTALDARLLRAVASCRPSDAASGRERCSRRVLDLPGGMRIGTIHAFCQALLRRFPLEAALSPHFTVVDEREAGDALIEAREDMLAGAHGAATRDALRRLAGLTQRDGLSACWSRRCCASRERLAGCLALGPGAGGGATPGAARHTCERGRCDRGGGVAGRRRRRCARRRSMCRGERRPDSAPRMRSGCWNGCAAIAAERLAQWSVWRCEFLTKEGEPRARRARSSTRRSPAAAPALREAMLAEAERVAAVEDARRALRHGGGIARAGDARRAGAGRLCAAQGAAGLLDYDDLIGRTSALLVDPGAAWVLYKLDGGLDHLLLDEVQDTAPAQWRIAHALTDGVLRRRGRARRARARCSPSATASSRSTRSRVPTPPSSTARAPALRDRVVAPPGSLASSASLDVSFRSTAPVLDAGGRGVRRSGWPPPAWSSRAIADALRRPRRAGGHGGAVAAGAAPAGAEPQPWTVPERNRGLTSAPQRLAEALAEWIARRDRRRA